MALLQRVRHGLEAFLVLFGLRLVHLLSLGNVVL